jgi:hypothetical protein
MKEIIGLIIFIMFFYLYYKNKDDIKEKNKPVSYKDILLPKITNKRNEFKEIEKSENDVITKFLLRIQLYYYYNEEAYEEMVEELENFLILFRSVNIDNSYGGVFYDLMVDKKRSILNNLRSIGIKLPEQYNLKDALDDLENILNDYLDKVYYLYKNYIHKNGYDYTTKVIDKNNMAYNRFENESGSYSYY